MTAADDELHCWAPWCTETERALRARLYRSRDICGARAARSDGWTYLVFKTGEDLAADYIWRRATEDELLRVANAVGRMIQSGTELEQGGLADA